MSQAKENGVHELSPTSLPCYHEPVSQWDDDARLVEEWQRSRAPEVGRQLYERHSAAVIGFLRNKVPGHVEELVQETFRRAFDAASAGAIRDKRAFRSFIIGIAHNTVINHNRKRSREVEFDPRCHSTADLGDDAFALLTRCQEQFLLLKALRRIPFESQVLLELVYFEQMHQEAIAEIFDVNYSTIRGRISTARQRLRKMIMSLEASPELLTSTAGDIEGWAKAVQVEFQQRRT